MYRSITLHPFVACALTALLLVGCGTGGGQDDSVSGQSTPVSTVAALPVADAGDARSVKTNTIVMLDGSLSKNSSSGGNLVFTWSLTARPAGSNAVLSGNAGVRPTFVPDVDGEYLAQLRVADAGGQSPLDSVTITAATGNSKPNAAIVVNPSDIKVGGDFNLTPTVLLDGTSSTDPDTADTISAYNWTVTGPTGSVVTVEKANESRATFTATTAGNYIATLVVSDGKLNSSPKSVTMVAVVANKAPIARISDTISVFNLALVSTETVSAQQPTPPGGLAAEVASRASRITLDGGTSNDPEGSSLRYTWQFVTRPTGSTAAFTSPAGRPQEATFIADKTGDYLVALSVSDGDLSNRQQTTISIKAIEKAPLVTNPTNEVLQGITVGQSTLLAAAGVDPNGDALTARWALRSRPNLSNTALTKTTGPDTALIPDVQGQYIVEFELSDGTLKSPIRTFTLTSTITKLVARISRTPSAPAWGSRIDLSASLAQVYEWKLVRPAGDTTTTLLNTNSQNTSFVPKLALAYTVELVVYNTDAAGNRVRSDNTATDSFTVAPIAPIAVITAPGDNSTSICSSVELNGTASEDGASGDKPSSYLMYSWSLLSRPGASAASGTPASPSKYTISPDLYGTYRAQLTIVRGAPFAVATDDAQANVIIGTNADLTEGQRLFEKDCDSCHRLSDQYSSDTGPDLGDGSWTPQNGVPRSADEHDKTASGHVYNLATIVAKAAGGLNHDGGVRSVFNGESLCAPRQLTSYINSK